LQGDGVSGDWNLLLAVARDRAKAKKAKKRSSADVDIACEDEESAAQHSKESATSNAHGEHSVGMVPSSWRARGGHRPRSPLRPGVYVGYDAPEHVKLEIRNNLVKKPSGLPERARATFDSGRFPGISPPSRPVTSDAISKRFNKTDRGTVSVWNAMLAKIEDQGKTDESRAYEAWRKRVVECTRTMQLEVARFKLEDTDH